MSVNNYGKLVKYYKAVTDSTLPIFRGTWENKLSRGELCTQHLFAVNLLFPDLIRRKDHGIYKDTVLFRREMDYCVNYVMSVGSTWMPYNNLDIYTIPERIIGFSSKKEKWISYINKRDK